MGALFGNWLKGGLVGRTTCRLSSLWGVHGHPAPRGSPPFSHGPSLPASCLTAHLSGEPESIRTLSKPPCMMQRHTALLRGLSRGPLLTAGGGAWELGGCCPEWVRAGLGWPGCPCWHLQGSLEPSWWGPQAGAQILALKP